MPRQKYRIFERFIHMGGGELQARVSLRQLGRCGGGQYQGKAQGKPHLEVSEIQATAGFV